MNAVKIIFFSMIGTILAIIIIGYVLSLKIPAIEKLSTIIDNPTKSKVYNTLEPAKIKLTIKNGSNNQLSCLNNKENKTNTFLVLNGNEQRSYEDINEGEHIACSFKIDNGSSTILSWFHVLEGTYTLLFEKVPCAKCVGVNERWGTVVVNPKGERELQSY